ncbi:MAG: T9SS type A sorting domain-containing protein [Chitinophagales bacterium]|nr:T9SS type A sorting domain-containing protein [Chitinophagales bacterium]
MKLKHYSLLALCLLFIQAVWAQCIPTGVRPVFGTVTAGSGTVGFTNVPTGNVIQVNVPVANTQYYIDLCITNPGSNVPDGTNDGHLTVLNQNSAAATALTFFEDGCTNIVGNGWGPPVGTWTAPAAGTYFLYLTEWNAAGTDWCVADGVNNAYDFAITITPPPSNDLAIDSAYLPSNMFTSIPIQQLTSPFSVGARVKNMGSTTATNVTVNVRIRNLTTNTVVNTQTLTGPASLAGGATANVNGTAYNPPLAEAAYEFRYICSMTQTDGNHSNDTAFRYIIVDNSLMATDHALLFGTITNILGFTNNTGVLGQKFQFNVPTDIDTIWGYFVFGTANVGDSVKAVIYNTAGGLPTTVAAVSATRIFTIADTGGVLLPFVFAPNYTIGTGTYFIGMHQLSPRNFGLAHNAQNFIPGNALFSVAPLTTWNAAEAANFPGSFVIWVNTKLNCTITASGTPTSPTCGLNNGSIVLNVTGANGTPTYSWSNGASTANLSNVGPGNYTVTVSAGGCVTTTSVSLTNNGIQPTFSATPSDAACGSANGSVTTSVSGGPGPFTYTWSNNAGNVSSISNVASGSYSVTVTDGTCSASATAFVGNTGGPSASASGNNVSCNGGSNGAASASATGGTPGYTYSWSNGGSTAAISNLPAGNYTVTVSDQNNCLATASVTVSQPPVISPTVNSTAVNCHNGTNGTATASATGGTGNLAYLWSNSATTATINNLGAGNYCVTVTDANSCTVSACTSIANPTQVTGTINSMNVSCNGGTNGTATLTAAGGTGTFTYAWSNNATTANIGTLAAGVYTVTITDDNNCTATATTTITQPDALNLVITCNETILGQSTGSANVVVTGGTAQYSYSWSSGANTANAANLPAGIVTVTVTDANNCTSTANCEVQFTVGLEEVTAGISAISVYPNPSNGIFRVMLTLKETSTVEVSLVDVRGAVISSSKFESASTVNEQFDLTSAAKGIYYLKITTPTGVVSRKVTFN